MSHSAFSSLGHRASDLDGASAHVDDDVIGVRQWFRRLDAERLAACKLALPADLVLDGGLQPFIVEALVGGLSGRQDLGEQALGPIGIVPGIGLPSAAAMPDVPRAAGTTGLSVMEEADAADWLIDGDLVALMVQTLHQQDGYATTLLRASTHEGDEDGGLEDAYDRFSRFGG